MLFKAHMKLLTSINDTEMKVKFVNNTPQYQTIKDNNKFNRYV